MRRTTRKRWRRFAVAQALGIGALMVFSLTPRVLGLCFRDIIFRIPSLQRAIYLTSDGTPAAVADYWG